jgi:hypothetical protein
VSVNRERRNTMPTHKRIQPGQVEKRSASGNAALGLGAASLLAPFVAPYVHDKIDKLTGPKDKGPKVVLPPGVNPPHK